MNFFLAFIDLEITYDSVPHSNLWKFMTDMEINGTILKILKRRKESDTYLAADRRHHRSMQIAMKVDKVCSFQPALQPSSAEEEDSYFPFPPSGTC